jgi:hypothetical protein
VKCPGKEMSMEVHGTNTDPDLPLATNLRERLRCFGEGADAQYGREAYSALFEAAQVETSG